MPVNDQPFAFLETKSGKVAACVAVVIISILIAFTVGLAVGLLARATTMAAATPAEVVAMGTMTEMAHPPRRFYRRTRKS